MTNLIKILQEQKDFSETEIMIATYLLANFRKLAGMSTRQLGKNTYTNSAAIVRFSQKLGFSGYTEFRVQFLAEMMQYINHPKGEELVVFPRETAMGSLAYYITHAEGKHFQPMNANFGLFPELPERIRDKKVRYEALANRALESLEQVKNELA